jgi:hypothetical protein
MESHISKRKPRPVEDSLARYIWLRCLARALEDLKLPPRHLHASHDWFVSEVNEIGSYVWICHQIGRDPEVLRRKYRDVIYQEYT